jgi:LmbE family N-acetylglucosaminyl deacetylase
MTNYLFLHAHPDDEAIFNSGTIAHLADEGSGNSVHVLFGTDGALGENFSEVDKCLSAVRKEEAFRSCKLLGVETVGFLPYSDSGLFNESANQHSFSKVSNQSLLSTLESHVKDREIDVIVSYDDNGIYPHPDHLQINNLGKLLHYEYNLPLFETTIDREYLHFVENHVVHHATISLILDSTDGLTLGQKIDMAKRSVGYSTLDMDITNNVEKYCPLKREAIKSHTSQVPADSPLLKLDDYEFYQVYGQEWFFNRNFDRSLAELIKF